MKISNNFFSALRRIHKVLQSFGFTIFPIRISILCIFIASAIIFSSCGDKSDKTSEKASGLGLSNRDTTVIPGDDFFGYANGTWLKTAKFAPGLPFNGNLIEASLRVDEQIGEIINEIIKGGDYPANSPEGQIKAIYLGYLDTAKRNALGITPLKPELDTIFIAKTHADIARLMGKPGYPDIFGWSVFLDSKNTSKYVTYISQGSLGIGNIESYLNEGEPYNSTRAAYLDYIQKTFELAGIDNAKERATAILNFEKQLAKGDWSKTKQRDPVKMYNLMSISELKKFAPGFEWDVFLKETGRENLQGIVVKTDSAVRSSAETFGKTDPEDLRSFMAFRLINNYSKYLSTDFEQANFDFYDKKISGVTEPKPLKDRAVSVANDITAYQLGKVYVDKYYTKEVKEQIELLVGYLKKAVLKSLRENGWMDEATKQEAIRKFNKIHWKIGGPERLYDYSSMSFKEDDLVGNLQKINVWHTKDDETKMNESKRDWEWLLPPQVVNAYYQAEMNDVVLPIGILQPPFFDPNVDAAAVFGGILAIVGHEVCHGFDDKGSQSDADGLLRNWWSDSSRAEFIRRADILVNQYNQYSPIEGSFVNGKLTLGENIGDLGGLTIAYRAYRDYVNEHQGGKAPVINGLTGDQRFFLAFGQVWSFITTDDFARKQVIIDYHSPNKFRVNGIVRNLDPWYAAYDVKPENKIYMAPEERVVIW